MKRFTETQKWADPWFRRLSPSAKLLWFYLVDSCSSIGLIEVDFEAVKFHTGAAVTEKNLAELGERVLSVGGGKYFIPKFIGFQYGKLSDACPAHRPVLKLISEHGLERDSIAYRYPSHRVTERVLDKDKEEEEDKDKEKERERGEKKSTIPGGTVIPGELNTEDFKTAWTLWLDHLKAKRKPATIHAQDLQLARLAKLGAATAIKTIHHCIEHNWQGIYDINPNGTGGSSGKRSNPRLEGVSRNPINNYATARRKLEPEVAQPADAPPQAGGA